MKHELTIRPHNQQAHIDIENDIKKRKNGLFTFTIRVNNGNIVDYNVTDHIYVKEKYLRLKRIVLKKLTATHHSRERSPTNALWSDNLQRPTSRWGGYGRQNEHSQKPQKKI